MPIDGISKILRELDRAQRQANSDSDIDNESDIGELMMDYDNNDNDTDYESFEKQLSLFKNGNKYDLRGIVLYVYQPWCPHCQNFMPTWEREAELIKEKNGKSVKLFKIEGGDIKENDKYIPKKNTVPHIVMYYYKSPDGVVNKDLSDERTRDNLSKLVENVLENESDEVDEVDENKKKPKKKSNKQTGKGIVESVLTAGILGGAVISATKSPQVAAILKESVKGIESITSATKSSIAKISGKKPSKNIIKQGIASVTKSVNAQKYADATTDAIKGISQTTADVIQGKVKKLTQKDLMRIYKSRRSSRKSTKTSKTRKARK
jgi:thiol-disulfide isomerase/thioredoxin